MLFSAEEIILQHNVLGYRIDAYFPTYKLAIEVDEQGHNDRDIDYKIERQKAIERKLGFKFIRINPTKENFNIFVEICKMHSFIVKSTTKSLIDELSNKLLRLELKSNNSEVSKICCEKDTAYSIKMKLRTYCLASREHKYWLKEVTMTNQDVRNICQTKTQ